MRSLSLLLSANILNGVIGFVTSVLVLRYVDKEVIAVIYPLISILMIVGQFGDMGLSNSFIKIASFHYLDDRIRSFQFFNAAFKLKLFLCFLLMVIGIPLAPLIAKWTFGQAIHVNWVRLILCVTSLQIISSYGSAALQVEGKFRSLSASKVIPSLLKMAMIGIVVWLGMANLSMIFWAFALVPISTLFLTFYYTDKRPLHEIKSTTPQLSELFHVSKWVALSVLANAIMGQLDVLMTSSMAGVDELNRLLGGQKLASVFTILSISLVTVLLPKVSSMKSRKELNYFQRKTIQIMLPLAALSLILLPLSTYFIPFLLGDKYRSSIEIFNILMIGNIIGIATTPLGLILYNLNKESTFAMLNIVQLIFNAAGNYLFIPSYGATGASWITAAAKLIAVAMIYYQLWKEGILNYKEEKQ
jgi:O-antigen/teichoic acid export membrane protein